MSEREELERLRKLKRLRELEAKAAGGAPAQPAPFASPFLQRSIGMIQEAMATEPQTRNTIRTGPREFPTSSDRMSGREDTRIIVQAQRAAAAQAEAERKARVQPVERAAGEAGRAAMGEQWGDPMPFRESEFMLSPQETRGMQAERQVYRDADVTSALDAATIRGANSLALGIPGIVNKDFRGELAAAGRDQPVASLTADIAGFLAPSVGMWNTGRAAVNAFARPFIPRGADAASRGVRYIAPLTGEVAGAATQNAVFQAGVQEPIRAEMAGEDLTLSGMGSAAKRGATDPLNFLPLGLSAVNRTWNAVTSGIATPSARAAEMANRFGVGPRQTAASQGIAQTTQQLAGQVQPGDIAGFANIENMLRYALRDNPNIPDVNARIATGFERIRQSLPLADDPTLNLARLIEREFAEDAPQTRDVIRRFLLKVGMDTPGGGAIVGGAANEIRGQQVNNLRTEVESAFGAQPRTEANAAIQGSLDQFSQAYNTILPQAPRTGPQVDRALALLAREPQSLAILDDLAQSQNLTSEQFIERNPLQALHEVQSELARQARAGRASGADVGPLEITIRNMQRPLREGVPGYGDLQNLWRQWTQARERMGYVRGAEAGTAGELDMVPGFGEKVLGAGGVRSSEMGTQTAADTFLQMDDLSQRAAGLSVRDVISDELRKMRAAGVDQRYAAPARMAQVATEGGLDALRRVFGEAGDRVARRIEQFIDATEFARNIDPEFNSATMNKAQAMATGAQPFAGPLGQRAQAADSALSQSALADAALLMTGAPPILSIMRAPGIAARSLQPSQRTQQNIAQTLLRRGQIGSQVPPQAGGPPPIMPIDPAQIPGGGAPPSGGTPPPSGPPPQAPAPRTVGVAPAMTAPAGAPVAPTPTPAGPNPYLNRQSLRASDNRRPAAPEEITWQGPVPKEPQGLLAFIRKQGGIRENFGRFGEQGYMAGTVRQILGDVRSRPGLLNNKTGQTIDQITRDAQDAGFDIVDDEDFIRHLTEELQGRGKAYRIGEAEEWNAYQEFLKDQARNETNGESFRDMPFGINAQATLQQSALGSVGGSAYGSQNDVNGDGVIDEQDAYAGAFAGGVGLPLAAQGLRTVGQPRATSGRTVGAGLGDNPYFGRQSMRPPGSGPSPREIELRQQWSTATPIVTQARTTAQTAQQAADAALQSKAPADIARAKAEKKTLVSQLQEAQASRAGMDTPEDARLAETLASLTENTSDPVLLSTQISAAKTSLDRLLTDIGSPVEGNLIPVRTNILTRTQAPRSAAEGPQDRASVTRYAEGSDDVQPMGFFNRPPRQALGKGLQDIMNDVPAEKPKVPAPASKIEDDILSVAMSAPSLGVRGAPGQGRGPMDFRPIRGVREQLKALGYSDDELETALKKMYREGKVNLSINDDQGSLTDADRAASFVMGQTRIDLIAPTGAKPPIKGMGFGAGTPKTPEQAVRFETPGSPEYEAAVAKGLDMSQAGRMGRAKEMGFDTETVLYHGTDNEITDFRPSERGAFGPGVYLSEQSGVASRYGPPSKYHVRGNILDTRPGKPAPKGLAESAKSQLTPEETQRWDRLWPQRNTMAVDAETFREVLTRSVEPQRVPEIMRRLGFDGMQGIADGHELVIFDPSNIRSVNAAFDPEKSGSSTLLAAAPFAAVSGAGLTLAGEDARNQRTVGKPKTSQSARTVGKAKTN